MDVSGDGGGAQSGGEESQAAASAGAAAHIAPEDVPLGNLGESEVWPEGSKPPRVRREEWKQAVAARLVGRRISIGGMRGVEVTSVQQGGMFEFDSLHPQTLRPFARNGAPWQLLDDVARGGGTRPPPPHHHLQTLPAPTTWTPAHMCTHAFSCLLSYPRQVKRMKWQWR